MRARSAARAPRRWLGSPRGPNLWLSSKASKHRCIEHWSRGLATTTTAYTQETVSVRGVDFGVAVYRGNDETPVLCIPGALGTGPSDFGDTLLSGSLGGRTVISVDPRGLLGDFPLDFIERDAEDAAAVMNRLGFQKYDVCGWSDGANTALHLASQARKLVLWGGNAYVTKEDVAAWEKLRNVDSWSDRVRRHKANALGGLQALQSLNDAATDGWIRHFHERGGDVALSIVHDVRCPTLLLHGDRDVICSAEHARYLARHIATSQLVVFPDGKHNLHQQYADDFGHIVRQFLDDDDDDGAHGAVDETTAEPRFYYYDQNRKRRMDTKHQPSQEEPEIDHIAYAFMGSKTLAAALDAGVFEAIAASGDVSVFLQDIEAQCKVRGERLRTLLSACVALDLIHRRIDDEGRDVYSLPRASREQLVRSSRRYWGDYILGQVDGLFYNRLMDLNETLRTGTALSSGYEAWFDADPEAAKRYTQAQHNGSLATAYAMLKRLKDDFEKPMRMLDVGGGSGAFSIATARNVPEAECVVLDLPHVTAVANEIVGREEEDVRRRVTTQSLSATAPDQWTFPDASFDVVLCSYVSGSIPADALPGLYRNAYRVLKPGGRIIVHDFMVHNDGRGPRHAALWALAHVSVNPEGMGLRPNRIVRLLSDQGFAASKVDDLIPDATQMIVATKPSLSSSSSGGDYA